MLNLVLGVKILFADWEEKDHISQILNRSFNVHVLEKWIHIVVKCQYRVFSINNFDNVFNLDVIILCI